MNYIILKPSCDAISCRSLTECQYALADVWELWNKWAYAQWKETGYYPIDCFTVLSPSGIVRVMFSFDGYDYLSMLC